MMIIIQAYAPFLAIGLGALVTCAIYETFFMKG
jgi:hypothetical protein